MKITPEIEKKWEERRKSIYTLHLEGKSYNQLARMYNISPTRIGQIINKEKTNETETPTS